MDLKLKTVTGSGGEFLTHDIVFENGRFEGVDKIEEIKNRLICNLSVYLGEMFTDTSFGVDYHNNVFGHEVTDTETIDELKSNILDTRGVTAIDTFSLTRAEGTRLAVLVSQVTTTDGEINLTTPIQT